MSINVIELIRATLPESVLRPLSNCLGLPPEAVTKVMEVAAPSLVAALINKSATLDGARSLFATILAPEVEANIGEQLPRLFSSTTGVTQLSATGRQLLEHTVERRIDGLSDAVSMQSGVPAHATHAMTGITGAILLGVLKRQLLDHRGNIGYLPTLLGQQLPVVSSRLNDGLTTVLGLGSAGAFTSTVASQLRAVTAHFEHPATVAASSASPAVPVQPAAEAAQPTPRAVVEPVVHEVHRLGLKACHWFGAAALSALIGALAALLTWFALANCPYAARWFGGATAHETAAIATAPVGASDAASAQDAAASATGAVQAAEVTPAPAPAKDSQLIFSVDQNGKPSITARVQTIAEKSALLNALTKKFGAGHFNADVAVDETTKPADWLTRIDELLPLMAVPGAEVKIDGTQVELSGAAADPKAGWLDRLKALFGASYQVGGFDVAQAVASATQSFQSAVKSLLAPGSSCATADVVKTLNLQVVNFASRDAHVPASAIDDLNKSAQVLNACSNNGKAAKLEVAGYSDNVGGDAANLELSKERAEAVRTFLVKAGVPAATLIARGYGSARPVANNATDSGRFANRRIEFSEAQTR